MFFSPAVVGRHNHFCFASTHFYTLLSISTQINTPITIGISCGRRQEHNGHGPCHRKMTTRKFLHFLLISLTIKGKFPTPQPVNDNYRRVATVASSLNTHISIVIVIIMIIIISIIIVIFIVIVIISINDCMASVWGIGRQRSVQLAAVCNRVHPETSI